MKKSRTILSVKFLQGLLACGLLFGGGSAGAALDLAQEPLFVSAGAAPNVMLLLDNSGSMEHIIPADSYNPDANYNDWGNLYCTRGRSDDCYEVSASWSSNWSSPRAFPNGLYRGSSVDCSDGWIRGRRSNGDTKCLKVPAPEGPDSNVRYPIKYLNYLFDTYTHGTDLTGGTIPRYRMAIARDVARDVVLGTDGMRFGLTTFNYEAGGTIRSSCGTASNDLVNSIDNVGAETWTPLAETYYEITRYFRGLTTHFGGDGSYTSPVQYRCQKNFVVILTDGLPTDDTNFPNDDPDDPDKKLPNWDGIATETDSTTPPYPQHSDGHGRGNDRDEGHTLYLDDLAKFGFDIDMMGADQTDNASVSFDDNGGRFQTQNLRTFTIGFNVDNQLLQDAADYGGGSYYTADTAEQLSSSLRTAVTEIMGQSTSAAAIATNSTRVDGDTLIYQARFNTLDWSGELRAFGIEADGSVGEQEWEASTLINVASREIFSWKPAEQDNETSRGISFHWANLNSAQQAALNTDMDGLTDSEGSARLSYLRGSAADEVRNGGTYRDRAGLLGDIINSNPLFVGQPDYRYDLLPEAIGNDPDPDALSNSYIAFRTSAAYQDRSRMLYVGANDGMLHAFDAESGEEKFAYVPNAIYKNLSRLTSPDYSHQAYVDGSPRSGDAYLDVGGNGNKGWHTVMLGTLGAGGKGVFALDITEPDSFSPDYVLWEFSVNPDASPEPAHNDILGYTYGQATIARLESGDWVALIGNGYNSNDQTAALFVLDLATGAVLKTLDTGRGSAAEPNGLGSPVPVDVDGDRITDVVYAGDLHGNLWKFDLNGNNSNGWDVAFKEGNTLHPLFTARDDAGNVQPITARPSVGAGAEGGVVVYFGTGKYIENRDARVNDDDPNHSFYAIHDEGVRLTGRAQLREQLIIQEQSETFETPNGAEESYDLRVTTQRDLSDSHKGWYLDLLQPGTDDNGNRTETVQGERVISDAVLRNGRIIFTTLVPLADPCGFGGDSWLMELDAATGGRLDQSPFDLNGDNRFTDGDYVTITITNEDGEEIELRVPTSGKRSKEGIIGRPAIISAGDGGEYKYTSGTSGEIEMTRESGGTSSGRQSWRQLQ